MSNLSKHLIKKKLEALVTPINIFLMVLSVFITSALFIDEFLPSGRDPSHRTFMISRAWVPIVIFVVSLVAVFFFMKKLRSDSGKQVFLTYNVIIPLVFFLNTILIQLGFIYMCGEDWISSIMSSNNLFFYRYAPTSDVPKFLEWWFSQMRAGVAKAYGPHRQGTHLPGWSLLLYLVFSIVGGKEPFSSVIAVIVLSSLTVFPLYFLVRELYDLKTAILACIIYLYVPTLVLHIPWMDLTLGFFTTLVVLLFFYAMKKNKIRYAFVSGLVFFIALFMCFAPLVIPVLLFTWAFFTRKSFSYLVRVFLAFGLGTLFLPIFLSVFFNLPIFQSIFWVYEVTMYWESQINPMLMMKDPEMFSWPRQMYFFFVFAGVSVSFLFFESLAHQVYDFLKNRTVRPFLLSFLVMMSFFLYFIKLEFMRIGLFLVPLLIVISTHELVRKGADKYVPLVLTLQFLQTAIFYLFVSRWLAGYPLA